MHKVAQIKYFYFLLIPLLLSSCLSNTVNVKPNYEEYTQLVNTPVYIKKAASSDQNNYEIELRNHGIGNLILSSFHQSFKA